MKDATVLLAIHFDSCGSHQLISRILLMTVWSKDTHSVWRPVVKKAIYLLCTAGVCLHKPQTIWAGSSKGRLAIQNPVCTLQSVTSYASP